MSSHWPFHKYRGNSPAQLHMYSFQNDGCMTKSPAKWPMPSTLQAFFGQGLSFPPKKKFNGSSTMKGLWELLDHDTGTLDLGCFKGHCIFSSGGAVFFLVEWFPFYCFVAENNHYKEDYGRQDDEQEMPPRLLYAACRDCNRCWESRRWRRRGWRRQ